MWRLYWIVISVTFLFYEIYYLVAPLKKEIDTVPVMDEEITGLICTYICNTSLFISYIFAPLVKAIQTVLVMNEYTILY